MARKRRWSEWLAGFRYGAPVMLGYAPVSFAFAVAAVGNGIPWPIVLLISLTNLTSAGQQAGAGLLAAGAAFPEIGVTVFIINLRYMLMSLSLSQKMLKIPLAKRLFLANGVTDEIFVLGMQKEELSGWFFIGLVTGPYVGWALGTLFGALAGTILPASLASALGIALYAMFIAIVVPEVRREHHSLWVVLCAVGLSCLFRYAPVLNQLSSGWALIISAVAASLLGAWLFPVDAEKKEGGAA